MSPNDRAKAATQCRAVKVCQGLVWRLPDSPQTAQGVMEHIWKPLIEPLLERLDPDVIVEIGSSDGPGHHHIVDYCRRTRARLHVVYPPAWYDTEDERSERADPLLFGHAPGLELVDKNPDVILIEGSDWDATTPELDALEARANERLGRFPLVIVHGFGTESHADGGRDESAASSSVRVSHNGQPEEGMDREHGVAIGGTPLDLPAALEGFRRDSPLDLELAIISEVDGLGILYPDSLRHDSPDAVEFVEILDSPSVAHSLLQLGNALHAQSQKLDAANRRYERLRSRRSVGLALRVAEAVKPLLRLIRRARGEKVEPTGRRETQSDATPKSRRALSQRAQRQLARELSRRRAGSRRASGPMVTVIVLTRDGARHLERLLPSFDKTTYRSFEVIVVDNGSTDGTAEVLEEKRSFPVRVIRNDANVSFSEGNNQAASVAGGDYLLLLNNDIEPINEGWLGAMVDALEQEDEAVACGALLVHPVRGDPETDLTVQHFGTSFSFSPRGVRGVNVTAPDPLAPALEGVVDVPAATAAALMVPRSAFDEVGGLDEGYVYGTEDIDLCLKLSSRGRIIVTGQAALFHHESATQDRTKAEITDIHRSGNRQLLMETWGPRLTRSVRRDRLTGGGRWTSDRPRTVAITLTQDDITKGWGDYYTAHELGDAFVDLGWDVVYAERYQDRWYQLNEDIDLLISLLDSYDVREAPSGAVTVAWVRNWVDRWLERPWFDRFDVVAASSHKGGHLLAQRSRFDPAIVPMATNPVRFFPGDSNPTFECDYAFTGNNWGQGRGIIPLLDVHPGERFLLFGKGWDQDPRMGRYWRGHLEYELLPELYRSTKIVLDDTAGPTLPYAFLNGRVFDGLASGALVITNNVEGSQEMFDGLLPTYTSRDELRAQLDKYLGDDGQRTELVERLRDRVLENHSYSTRPKAFLDLALEQVERPRAAIKIPVPDEASKRQWGDTHFGEALASTLTERGMPSEVHILPEWDLPENQDVDVVIHIRGLSSYAPKPAHVNVLWIISHPDDVSTRECEKYDLVMVASLPHAEWLETQIETPVVFMPQATDRRRFHPVEPDPDLEAEVLFVGNRRGQDRPAVDWATSRGLPLTVYGKGWNGRLEPGQLRAEYFRNDELATLYASAKVVLNDHWPDMREAGFISNRIYDAMAAGAVVVSDPVQGLDELFGELVPTYSNAEELEARVRGLLEDDDRRQEISDAAAKRVAGEHTFAHRAEQIVTLIGPHLENRTKDLEGEALDIECAARGHGKTAETIWPS